MTPTSSPNGYSLIGRTGRNIGTFRDSIEANVLELLSRPVIVMRKDGGLAGYSTRGELIEGNPVGAG